MWLCFCSKCLFCFLNFSHNIHERIFNVMGKKFFPRDVISMGKLEVVTTLNFPAPLLFGFFCVILIRLSRGGFQSNVRLWFCMIFFCFVFFSHNYMRDSRITINGFDLNTILLEFFKMFFEYICMSALYSIITNLKMEYQWPQTLFWFQIFF